MVRSTRYVGMFLLLGVASIAAADGVKLPPCPGDMSPRLCLTLLARSVAQTVPDAWRRSEILVDLAEMQRADHRDDLALETLRLASTAAAAIEHEVNRASSLGSVAARRFALGDTQSVEADSQTFSVPHARARYLTLVLGAALAAGDEQAIERLVIGVRQAVDEAGVWPGSRPQGVRVQRSQAYKDLILVLTKHGRRELADAVEVALADRHASDWLRATERSARFKELLGRGSDREVEEFVQKEPPFYHKFYWKEIAEARIGKKDHAAAIEIIERYIASPEREALLARAYLAKGEIGEAVKLAQRGSKDNWYEWQDIWTEIAIAQAGADLIDAAIASSSHAIYRRAEVKAAITLALARANRRREAIDMAKSAFDPSDENENGHWNGEDGAAEAFLAVGDFKAAASLAGKYCLLRVPLQMLERKQKEGSREEALAILDATDDVFLPCVQHNDDSDFVGRFLCDYAGLKPSGAALAKTAEVEAQLDDWRETHGPWVYSCIALARARSGDVDGARRIALAAPTAAAIRTALVSLTEFEAERDPSRAVELYRALLARDEKDVREGYGEAAIHGLMSHLTCRYKGSCAKN
jgi:hypothetical protein